MNQSPPTPEPLLSALAGARQYSDDLLRLPNVIGVGAAYKSVGGRRTDTYCVIVYVTRKESPANLGSLQRVPRDLSVAYERVPTDVVEIGPQRPFSDQNAYRPIRGGCQIGAGRASAGTAGGVFFDRREPKSRVLLTACHCLADPPDSGVLPPSPLNLVVQPAATGDGVGASMRVVPWAPAPPGSGYVSQTVVDAGIVELAPTILARYEVLDIPGKHPFWASRPYPGLKVVHRGWSGLLRTGTVEAVGTTLIQVKDGFRACRVGGTSVWNQTVFTIRADTVGLIPGDSGSLVVDSEGKATRGLIFAGDGLPGGISSACDIIDVMYAIDIDTALNGATRVLVTNALLSQWKKLGAMWSPGLIDVHFNKFDRFLSDHLSASTDGQLSGALGALLKEEPGRAIAHAVLTDDEFAGLLNRAIGPWLVQPNAFEMLDYELPEEFTPDLLAALTRLDRITPDILDIDWLADVFQDTAGRSIREVLDRKVRQNFDH